MLSIARPTSNTVLYTISTRAPATSLTTKLRRHLLGLVRLLVAASTLILLYTKLLTLDRRLPRLGLQSTRLPAIADQAPWPPLLALVSALLYVCVRRPYTSESLLVMRGLGVQTSSSAETYLSSARTRFIPTSAIQDILLHEGFKGFEVKFYLAIVVEGEESLVVVFPKLFPRRTLLEEVWRGTKACLYEPKS